MTARKTFACQPSTKPLPSDDLCSPTLSLQLKISAGNHSHHFSLVELVLVLHIVVFVEAETLTHFSIRVGVGNWSRHVCFVGEVMFRNVSDYPHTFTLQPQPLKRRNYTRKMCISMLKVLSKGC